MAGVSNPYFFLGSGHNGLLVAPEGMQVHVAVFQAHAHDYAMNCSFKSQKSGHDILRQLPLVRTSPSTGLIRGPLSICQNHCGCFMFY